MIINHKFTMDLSHRESAPKIDVMQDDKYTRNLQIRLMEFQKPFALPDGYSVLVRYEKPDQTRGAYDTLPEGSCAWSSDGNVLTVAIAPQVCTAPGIVTLAVTIIAATSELTSFPVQIFVHPVPGKSVTSQDYFSVTNFIPQPPQVQPGQYLAVSAVDGSGKVLALCGVNPTTSIFEEACKNGYTGTEAEFYHKIATTFQEDPPRKICTIIDDGATSSEIVERFYAALSPKGVQGNFALFTNYFTKDSALKNTLLVMERAGYQVVLHGYSDLTTYDDPALCEDDLVHTMQDLQKAYFGNFRFWVYPKGACSDTIEALAKKWGLKAGIAIGNEANTSDPADGKYHLKRFALEERDSTGASDPDGYTTTLQGLKASILAASQNSDWVILKTQMANWTDGNYQRIHEIIDYARSLGYEFMTLGEAWHYRKEFYR